MVLLVTIDVGRRLRLARSVAAVRRRAAWLGATARRWRRGWLPWLPLARIP